MPVMREVVRDGQNGVLVDPSDPAGIVARVRELEQDPALRARLVRGGLETARQNTWRERARRVLHFLDGHTAR
jgi:glycosyltransferase involved in cell wall biosynthesis